MNIDKKLAVKDIRITTVSMSRYLFEAMENLRCDLKMSRSTFVVEEINEYYEKTAKAMKEKTRCR